MFMSEDKSSISLRTLDNIDVRICQDSIKITEKVKTKIETKSNDVFIGFVSTIDEKEMTLLTDGAGEIIIPLSSVLNMKAVNDDGSDFYRPKDYPEDYQDQVDPDPEIKGGYPMLGAIIGYPSIASILVGYQGDDFGFRIDGMSHTVGTTIRLNFLMNISKYKNFENNVSLGLGLWSLKETSEAFFLFGAWYDFNSHGFFLEVGAFVITEDYTPTFSLHLGYVYRFNRE